MRSCEEGKSGAAFTQRTLKRQQRQKFNSKSSVTSSNVHQSVLIRLRRSSVSVQQDLPLLQDVHVLKVSKHFYHYWLIVAVFCSCLLLLLVLPVFGT